jgi:hypothetical protein
MIVGLVIGWIMGSRTAQDAYAAELRRREAKEERRKQAEGRREATS